ncbi:PmoA family protein [Prosthecobacter fluviatilis]|uniref:PmoA family protein n=1 Tax=Prosthecobacter fluviatilis TaxID=445931 RepID=A0ABW0KJB9_9BACT
MKLLLASFLLTSLASAAQFSVEKTATGGAIVKVDGQVFAEYVVDQANKPYLAPVFGPTGKQMTRNYPMITIEGEQHDHPHHRGICFGHEGINGIESWAERATFGDSAKTAERVKSLGSEKHREFKTLEAKPDSAVLVSIIDYLDPSGKKYLEEERTMIFTAGEGTRSIELKQVLLATEGPVNFEDKKDAGLSIRVPTEMAVNIEKNKKGSGHIINSEGITDVEAWGKRAKWCDYYGTVGGEKLGVAMFNHPSSFRFPTPWHVRDYGLFTANPFGTKALDKNAPDGAYELKKGEYTLLHHLFYFHKGDEKEGKVAEAYEAFAKK